MIHAYDDVYLEKAQLNFAEMLDYAVRTQSMDLPSFFRSFLSTKVSKGIENGDYRYITGMSGIELCYEVLDQSGVKYRRREQVFCVDRSREFWCGWVLAYYQWYSNLSFGEIEKHVSIKTILEMYIPYHEMDVQQFCDELDRRIGRTSIDSRLKQLRRLAGLSQKDLSVLTGIPLRTLQEYEQGRKDLEKAQGDTLLSLARVLCSSVEDLLK